MATHSSGPLAGLRVVELAGLGPGPHAAMMLADHGAHVVSVLRPGASTIAEFHHTLRGKVIVRADLKNHEDLARVRSLIERADVLIEGFRPGVAERLGLGPDELLAANPRLVYGRMTGWGQTGPMAALAGHDINYLSITGALDAIGPTETPVPPVNFLGDFGGGSMLLLSGILMALIQRGVTGRGDVVDAAIVDGVALLQEHAFEMGTAGLSGGGRATNLLDGGAPFYRCFRCSDERFVAVGALEPQFYSLLLTGLGIDPTMISDQYDRSGWPTLHETFERTFAERTRDEWMLVFNGSDACVSPVLTITEAPDHFHMQARGSLQRTHFGISASPAPRFGNELIPGADARESDLATAIAEWVDG